MIRLLTPKVLGVTFLSSFALCFELTNGWVGMVLVKSSMVKPLILICHFYFQDFTVHSLNTEKLIYIELPLGSFPLQGTSAQRCVSLLAPMDVPHLLMISWSPNILPGVGLGGFLLMKSESLHCD